VTSCVNLFSGAAVTPTPDNFIPIMTTSIKVSNSQSLFVTPSLVTGLYTNTAVKTHTSGGTGSTSTAVATGGVYLRAVLYDESGNMIVAYPLAACSAGDIFGCVAVPSTSTTDYGVVLDQRVQTLSQTLSGCTVSTGGTCSFDLTTQLILQTASAHLRLHLPECGRGHLHRDHSSSRGFECYRERHLLRSGRVSVRPRLGHGRKRQVGTRLLVLARRATACTT